MDPPHSPIYRSSLGQLSTKNLSQESLMELSPNLEPEFFFPTYQIEKCIKFVKKKKKTFDRDRRISYGLEGVPFPKGVAQRALHIAKQVNFTGCFLHLVCQIIEFPVQTYFNDLGSPHIFIFEPHLASANCRLF